MASRWVHDVDSFYFRGPPSLGLELGRGHPIHLDAFFLRSGLFGDHLSSFFYPHLCTDQPGENLDAAHGDFT